MPIMLALLALPIVEIALFIIVGGWIGLWPTLGLVVLAGLVGVTVIRAQGAQAFERLRAAAAADKDPSGPMAHSALLVVAGLLLIVPGFFTDALGLLLLIPQVRAAAIRRFAGKVRGQTVVFSTRGGEGPRRPRDGDAIEVDYEVLDDVPPAERGASGWTRSPN
ncbi:FxsA family protein [Amaricoccus sp.]|uniref:FxsA family protein n=1 Tax=Amaricoccus sp. TaxID=1872485 RepID=UPI001B736EB3|nr:FxsA family protein [Amaricoccus sp.]MBP7002414.1 FxsA family protein [Amaricoccus sp.]